MHVGSVSVFEGEIPFETLVRSISSRLELLPRYRQKIVFAPFNLSHPGWEDDPNFDIKQHIHQVTLSNLGSDEDLRRLAAQLFTGMMDREKPLWEVFLVNGLQRQRSALICRVHHCMVDGVSGVELMKLILDYTADPPPIADPKPFTPPQTLDAAHRFIEAVHDGFQESIDRWQEIQKTLLSLTNPENKNAAGEFDAEWLKVMGSPAVPLPFNKPCTGERSFGWMECRFSDARAIRSKLGGTVNDVVLAILTGAVGRYLEHHALPTQGRVFRPMVPVSLRRDEQQAALGKSVSLLPMEIPLDISDPVERLQFITAKTKTLKESRVAERLSQFTTLVATTPVPLQAYLGATTVAHVSQFNIVCTNIPGPQIPLFALGKRMLTYYPFVPIASSMGASCAVTSYDQKLFFGLSADSHALPDVDRMIEFLNQSFIELKQSAGVVSGEQPIVPEITFRQKSA